MKLWKTVAVSGVLVMTAGTAYVHLWYAAGSLGYLYQSDSDNSGRTGAFNTGNGAPALPV